VYHLALLGAAEKIAEITQDSYDSKRMKEALNAVSYPVSREKARRLQRENRIYSIWLRDTTGILDHYTFDVVVIE